MKRRFLKTAWILILIAIMILPPLRIANAAGFNYYTSIFVKQNPKKMEYWIGESFDKTGMLIYGNRMRTDGKTDQCDLGIDDLTFSPAKFTKKGQIKVTLTLNCMAKSGKKEPFTTSLYVTVYDPEEGDPPLYWVKKITAEAKKTSYLVGESFDLNGLKVWAYSEGEVPPGSEKWDCTNFVKKVSPTKFTKSGEQYVTVTANLTTQYSTADFTAKIKVKVYDPIEITKHPGSEIVEEGGACNFTVKAKNADKFTWYFVKGNSVVSMKDKDSFFPGLKVSGANEKKLKLSNIPMELDGWSVMCEFSNKVQTVQSNTADIDVYEKDAPEPTEKPTPAPTEAPTAEPTANPSEAPTAEPASPDPVAETTAKPEDPSGSGHTHSFDGVYRYNSISHWLECSCGEKSGEANHIVTEWTILSKPTKNAVGFRKGNCAVCGAEVLDTLQYDDYQGEEKEDETMSWLLIAGIALAGLAAVGCIVSIAIVFSKKKRRSGDE